MVNEISFGGGARIGWLGVSWPFVTLTVTQSKLDLDVALISNYAFTPEQVVTIEPCTIIPFLGWGIRIRHNISDFPQMIVFSCVENPNILVNRIKSIGFVPRASPDSMPTGRGAPARWQVIGLAIAAWIVLMSPGFDSTRTGFTPGWLPVSAFILLFVITTATLHIPFLQRIILKQGRSVNEIKAWLLSLRLLSAIMSIVLFFIGLAGGNK